MGSSSGLTLTNIFIGYIKFKNIPAFKNVLAYLRYVGECFVVIRSMNIMDEFFSVFNNAHNSITLKMKKELFF